MKEKKSIDRIFQEKFKDFESTPKEEVWDNIASRLDKKEKKRPLIIPLWFKIGGVAAVLAIILASLVYTGNQRLFTGEPEIVHEKPEKSTNQQKTNKESSGNKNERNLPEEKIASEKEKTPVEAGKTEESSNNKSSEKSALAANSDNSAKAESSDKNDASNIASGSKLNSGEEEKEIEGSVIKDGSWSQQDVKNKASNVIAQAEIKEDDSLQTKSAFEQENALTEIEKQKKNKTEEALADIDAKKMSLSTFAAPIFYNNLGSGNELSNQFSNNSTSSEVTLSYGVKIAYNISDKLRIRTGISKVDINKNIQDISYSPTAMSVGFENINPVENNIEIRDNSPEFSENGLPLQEGSNALSTSVFRPGEINQQFGYIEIPLELEYALINKKFSLSVIGGGSSLFLDNNRVQLVSGESKTDLGEATNINSTSFSTNIGVGMGYKLTDKFSISVEPIFKYQINTFNNVNDVQPTNFGVYSGLSYRF